jgi:hypothetical protein
VSLLNNLLELWGEGVVCGWGVLAMYACECCE